LSTKSDFSKKKQNKNINAAIENDWKIKFKAFLLFFFSFKNSKKVHFIIYISNTHKIYIFFYFLLFDFNRVLFYFINK